MGQHVHQSIDDEQRSINKIQDPAHTDEEQDKNNSKSDIQNSTNHINFEESHVRGYLLAYRQNRTAKWKLYDSNKHPNYDAKYSGGNH